MSVEFVSVRSIRLVLSSIALVLGLYALLMKVGSDGLQLDSVQLEDFKSNSPGSHSRKSHKFSVNRCLSMRIRK